MRYAKSLLHSSRLKIGHFLFETANALYTKEQFKLRDDALAGHVSKDNYAKRWEFIEYKASQNFSLTILACIKKNMWPKEVSLGIPELFPPTWKSFWKLIEKSPHLVKHKYYFLSYFSPLHRLTI